MASLFQEGNIQDHYGYLSRKTGIFRTWERVPMRIQVRSPGHYIFFQMPEDTQSDPAYCVRFQQCYVMPCDPRKCQSAKEFLSIFVKFDAKSEIHHFLAENVQEQRLWMISFGATGHGLFSEDSGQISQPLESWIGKWDVMHPSMVPDQEGIPRVAVEAVPNDRPAPPAYDNVIGSMVSSIEQAMLIHQMEHLDIDVEPPLLPPPSFTRRPMDDTFLPPHGPPLNRPVSVGFGAELKLPEHFQQIWDPSIEKNVFIDHETKNVSWNDPRPPEPPPPEVQKKVLYYGDQRGTRGHGHEVYVEALTSHSELRLVARTAKSKPQGLVIQANGFDGQPGQDMQRRIGVTGTVGHNGGHAVHRGHDGERGGRGGPGGPGVAGGHGCPGSNGSDLELMLQGDPSSLVISGDFSYDAYLGGEETDHVVFVNCRGGNGGRGGMGGQGGTGGKGGRGGNGAKGKKKYGKNQRGGSGGDGGKGGTGGEGGRGGPGGRGGAPGSGGNVNITSFDARLFMLCEIDATSGELGKGGDGGRGGCGGHGGEGGNGAKGGSGPGGRGRYGQPGSLGDTGNSGIRGQHGSDYDREYYGSIMWSLIDPLSGDTVEIAGRRYDLLVRNFDITSEIDDNVFEPNEKVYVSDITVQNHGDIRCPVGATLTFKNSPTVNFVPKSVVLPMILPHDQVVVTERFTGRIKDLPSPNRPGVHLGQANLIARVHMLNRTFDHGLKTKTIEVQYPLKLAAVDVPSQMGRGEEKVIQIHLENISSMPYGEGPESGGFVDVRVRLDRRLLPVPKRATGEPYFFTFDPVKVDSVCCKVLWIEANSTWTLSLPVYLDNKAELYDKCLVEVDLYLRGKLIEYNHAFIRICPFYMNMNPPADILFVTGPQLSRKSFNLWQTMFDWLNITLDFWDAERYNGFSLDSATGNRHNPVNNVASWVDHFRGRIILGHKLELSDFLAKDIISHFYNSEGDDQLSTLVYLPDGAAWENLKNSVYTLNFHLVETEGVEDIGDRFSGTHLFKPSSDNTETALTRIQELIKKMEKDDPGHSYVLFRKEVNYEKTGAVKYSYGEADIKKVPLNHAAGFFMTINQNLYELHVDNPRLSPMTREVPIGSNFAQVMLLLILTAPPKVRTTMLHATKNTERIILVSPTGLEYSIRMLLAMALEPYVCFEVSSQPKTPVRLEAMTREVVENPNIYVDDTIALYLHVAAQSYLSESKHSSETCQQSAADCYDKMKQALTDISGHDKQIDLEKEAKHLVKNKDRITFSILLNEKYCICPHRYGYKDKMFNLDAALQRTRLLQTTASQRASQVGFVEYTV